MDRTCTQTWASTAARRAPQLLSHAAAMCFWLIATLFLTNVGNYVGNWLFLSKTIEYDKRILDSAKLITTTAQDNESSLRRLPALKSANGLAP